MLAPWVGLFADNRPKAVVLMLGNLLKGIGAVCIFLGLEPLLAYAIVGVGAAICGPAKYGILPEMLPPDRLVQANSWIEGSTIVVIIAGTDIGARGGRSIVAHHCLLWLVARRHVADTAHHAAPRGRRTWRTAFS